MNSNQGQRVEDLSEMVGGRFKLTTLVVKRMRDYYMAGGTFMPRVRNQNELLDLVLDQIERKEIGLRMPGETSPALPAGETERKDESGPDIRPETVMGAPS